MGKIKSKEECTCKWDVIGACVGSLNSCVVFWMNQVQMVPNVVGRW